jgi:hypothetical protein
MELQAIQTSSQAAKLRTKAVQERKRNVLVLVIRYLLDQGYTASAQALQGETCLSLDKFDCADNVDLPTIVQVLFSCRQSDVVPGPFSAPACSPDMFHASSMRPLAVHLCRSTRKLTCSGTIGSQSWCAR